jgi:hypothetical protein
MGVKSAHAFFGKKKLYLTGSPVSLEGVLTLVSERANGSVSGIFLDFMGCFFGLLMTTYNSKCKNPLESLVYFMVTHFPPDMPVKLHKDGPEKSLKDVLVFVFDGKRTEEKLATSIQRSKTRMKTLEKDRIFLDQVNPKARISKIKWDRMRKAERNAWSPTSEELERISARLQSEGYRVESAEGEADVCIAKKETALAISRDSDLFMHENVKWCAKLIIGRNRSGVSFLLMSRDHVLDTLKITNNAWTSLAIVSGNDYVNNVKQYGIGRNYVILKGIEKGSPHTIERLVAKYVKEIIPEKPDYFKNALKVFGRREETFDMNRESEVYKEHQQVSEKYRGLKEKVHARLKEIERENDEWKKELAQRSRNVRRRTGNNQQNGENARCRSRDRRIAQRSQNGGEHARGRSRNEKRGYNPFQPLALPISNERPENYGRTTQGEKGKTRLHGNSGGRYVSYKINVHHQSSNIPPEPKKPSKRVQEIEKEERDRQEKEREAKEESQEKSEGKSKGKSQKQTEPESKSKPKSKGKKAEKAKKASSSRSKRNQEVIKPPAGSRENTDETKKMKYLKEKYAFITYEIGDLKHNIKNGNAPTSLKQFCTETIAQTVTAINQLKRVAQLLVCVFLEDVMNDPQYETRRKDLISIYKGNTEGVGGTKFWKGLLGFLHKDKRVKVKDEDGDEEGRIEYKMGQDKSLLFLVEWIQKKRISVDRIRSRFNFQSQIAMSLLLNELARDLDTEFAGQVVGNLPVLKQKVCEFLQIEVEDIDKEISSQIGEQSDSEHITFNWLNQKLPRQERYGYDASELTFRFKYPLSSVTDCFVRFTETSLLQVLYSAWLLKLKESKGSSRAATGSKRKTSDSDDTNNECSKYFKERYNSTDMKALQRKSGFLQEFFGISMNKRKLCFLEQIMTNEEACGQWKLLCNTFETNGKVIKIHVLDSSRRNQKVELEKQKKWVAKTGGDIKRRSDGISDHVKNNVDNIWIVGLDFGVVYPVAATAQRGSGPEREVRQLAIKKNALGEPGKRWQAFLEDKKEKYKGLADHAEGHNPKKLKGDEDECDRLAVEDDLFACERNLERKENEDPKEYFDRYCEMYLELGKFYNSQAMKRKKWDYKKAQRAEYDRATHAILKMVDAAIYKKMEEGNEVVFVLGNAEFETKRTIHTSFEKHFVRKVRSLNYPVLYVNERYTSQRCPCCQDVNTATEAMCMRVKYCRTCKKYFHRDNMAGENMVQIGREIILTSVKGARPSYLEKSPDKASKKRQ